METGPAPAVLFVYNRPEHTEATLEALAANELAAESELVVFSDGPKAGADRESVSKVREIVGRASGFKSVRVEARERNLGLAKSVISGVSGVLADHGSAIVLEDDIVTTRDFLRFINESLVFYRDEKRVFSITGYSPVEVPPDYRMPTYLFYRCSSWGWATWKDRWERVDWDELQTGQVLGDAEEVESFNRGGEDLTPMLRRQRRGELDSWAIRWCYAHHRNNAYCLYPVSSRIRNIGLDGSGTHLPSRQLQDVVTREPIPNRPLEEIAVDPRIASIRCRQYRQSLRQKLSNFLRGKS